MVKITKDMIVSGHKHGFICLTTEDRNIKNAVGVVCIIGEHWFYLGLDEADCSTLDEFKANNTEEQIIDYIFNALEDMRNEPDIYDFEYEYYYHYLQWRLSKVGFNNDMNMKLWCRIGATLYIDDIEADILFGKDRDKAKQLLKQLIYDSKFRLDGESYVPEPCVQEFNEKYGKDYEVGDYEVNF